MNTPLSRNSFLLLLLLSVGAVRPLPARSDVPDHPLLPVEQLIAEVIANHPEGRFYEAEIDAARIERRTAGTLSNPELSVSVGRKRVTDLIRREGVAWSVGLQQTFEWPGRVALRKAIANGHVALAELGLGQFNVELAARIRLLALALHSSSEEEAAAREVAARFEALRDVLVQREPSGLTPALELRIIEAAGLLLHRQVSEAAIAARVARIALNQLRGLPADQPLRIVPPTMIFPAAPAAGAQLAAAAMHNFALRAREEELAQQGLRVSLARTERQGSFSIGPYVAQERPGERETEFGVEASVPLPIWNRRAGDVAVAEARERQAEAALFAARRELESRIAQQRAVYETKRTELEKWHVNTAAEFKAAAELADRHYRLGAVPVTTYVELQQQYLEAVGAFLQTRRETLEAAQELQRLTGVDLAAARAEP